MIAVVVGAAFVAMAASGALLRGVVIRGVKANHTFPFGTFAVNVSGSFAAGLLSHLTGAWATVVVVGFLGAYTTVSSFARDAVVLVQNRNAKVAATYVAATSLVSIVAAFVGLQF